MDCEHKWVSFGSNSRLQRQKASKQLATTCGQGLSFKLRLQGVTAR